MTDRALQLYVSAQATASFLEPEILTIPEETLLWLGGRGAVRPLPFPYIGYRPSPRAHALYG